MAKIDEAPTDDATASDREVRKRATGGGRKATLDAAGELALVALLRANPTAAMTELSQLVKAELGVVLGAQALQKALKRQGISKRQVKREWVPPGGEKTASTTQKRYGYQARHRVSPAPGRYPTDVTDAEWALIADLFEHKGGGKQPDVDRRHMLNAVLYVVRGGTSWRMLPADLPDWNNVYATFRRWVRDNVMERMYDRLRDMMRARVDREVSPTAAVLDSQSTKTSPQGGPKGFDGGKKVTGRKRHLVVDTLGLLLTVLVTTANVQDRNVAAQILASTKAKHPTVVKTYVDAGYCGAKTHAAVAQHGIELEVVKRPNHGNRQWLGDDELPLFPEVIEPHKPFTILPKRWVVERSNAWTERARRMNRDHDRLLKVSEAWIWLVHGRMLLANLTDVA
jgi:transposase